MPQRRIGIVHRIERLDRILAPSLAFLVDAYRSETVKDRKRVFLSIDKRLAPVKIAVLPLLKNKPEIVEMAHKLRSDISGNYRVVYDDTASIGRLYRRQDEIGTPYCVTVDVESLSDGKVTSALLSPVYKGHDGYATIAVTQPIVIGRNY